MDMLIEIRYEDGRDLLVDAQSMYCRVYSVGYV
jgi:hypothetical protein